MNLASTICLGCIHWPDPMHVEDDGWRGDCPWFLKLTDEDGRRKTCSYGCREEPACETECPGIEPNGWGPSPGGDPCHDCDGVGVQSWVPA